MTAETPTSPVASAPAEPKPNSFARIFGVLFSPEETFASIARRPTWAAPFIVLFVLSIVGGMVMAPRMDWAAPAREAMEQRGNVPADAAERAERMAGSFGKVVAYAAPIFLTIMMVILAGILLLAFRLFGGEGTFLQAWAATLYAYIPSAIKSIAIIVVLLMKGEGPLISPVMIPVLLRSNLAFLFDHKEQPMAFAFAANFDLFAIWIVILLVIGFAHLAKVSKGKSAAIIVSLWLVKCVLSLIGPAMQSLRK